MAEIVKSHHSGGDPIAILGLTYKPNTDVVEEAFGLLLAQELGNSGVPVMVYDPSANSEKVVTSGKNIAFAKSAEDCIAASNIAVLATPWPEFRDLAKEKWLHPGANRTVIDCWRYLPHLQNVDGIHYVRLGFGAQTTKPIVTASSAD